MLYHYTLPQSSSSPWQLSLHAVFKVNPVASVGTLITFKMLSPSVQFVLSLHYLVPTQGSYYWKHVCRVGYGTLRKSLRIG